MPRGLTVIEASTSADEARAADRETLRLRGLGETVVRVLPSLDAADRTRRRLADEGAPFVGVAVTTLDAWAADRWLLHGDGRRVVAPAERRSLVVQGLEAFPGSDEGSFPTRGMISLVERTVRMGAGLAGFRDPAPEAVARLCGEELRLMGLCRSYFDALARHGLVELSEASALLPGAMKGARWPHLVLEGVPALAQTQLDLCVAAATAGSLTYVCRLGANPAFAGARETAKRLEEACAAAGVPVARETAGGPGGAGNGEAASPWASAELAELAERLFDPQNGAPVTARKDVSFLLPAGRYAETELLASHICELVKHGFAPRDIAVVCTDPLARARALAGRLAERVPRGIGCLAVGSVPAADTDAGRLVAGIFRLASAPDPLAPRPDLWPTASDVARSRLSGIGLRGALDLDRRWRGRRATTPSDMLDDLAEAALVPKADGRPSPRGEALAEAIALVREGRLREGIERLEQGMSQVFDPAGGSDALLQRGAARSLAGFLEVHERMSGRPVTFDDIERLTVGLAVRTGGLRVAPSDIAAQDEAAVLSSDPNAVSFMTLSEVAGRRFRAVVLCDLTAERYPVADRTGAREALWEKLGLDPGQDAIDRQRWLFRCALEAASEHLTLERPLNDPEARETRPAAFLEEVIDCYRANPTDVDGLDKKTGLPKDGPLVCETLGEERFNELASPVTWCPARLAMSAPGVELTPDEARELGVYPAAPFSPSSIEAYLRCPLRWLVERRLPHDGPDAGFGPLEFGAFSHDVLHRFHARLPETGIERIDGTPEQERVWGPLLEEEFAASLASQPKADVSENPLVPVNKLEGRMVDTLRRELRDCVRRDARLPRGFVPRLHEWSFGTEGAKVGPVAYAGVELQGKIDRVDTDERGRAIVIDYKGSLGKGYSPGSPEGGVGRDPLEPPLHSQALMYAGALMRVRPDLDVVGSLYVSYSNPEAAGFIDAAVDPGAVERGAYLAGCAVPPGPMGEPGFRILLDVVEECVAEALEDLRDGHVEPYPRFGADSCRNCPVNPCPRRKA